MVLLLKYEGGARRPSTGHFHVLLMLGLCRDGPLLHLRGPARLGFYELY